MEYNLITVYTNHKFINEYSYLEKNKFIINLLNCETLIDKNNIWKIDSVAPQHIGKIKIKGKIDSNKNIVNVFIYEKTYLFISLDPLCNLIENIFNCILNPKPIFEFFKFLLVVIS